MTRTILQNAEVLASGQKTAQQDNKPITVQAVTILVDPMGAEKLALALHEGKLHLVLRNPEDSDTTTVLSLNTNEMLNGQAGTMPRSGPRERRKAPQQSAAVPQPVHTPAPTDEAVVRIIRRRVNEQAAPGPFSKQQIVPNEELEDGSLATQRYGWAGMPAASSPSWYWDGAPFAAAPNARAGSAFPGERLRGQSVVPEMLTEVDGLDRGSKVADGRGLAKTVVVNGKEAGVTSSSLGRRTLPCIRSVSNPAAPAGAPQGSDR